MLIAAARDGHLEVVRTLLSKYADIEAADSVSKVLKIFVVLCLQEAFDSRSSEIFLFTFKLHSKL